MNYLLILLFLCGCSQQKKSTSRQQHPKASSTVKPKKRPKTTSGDISKISKAYKAHKSDIQVKAKGTVIKILSDDTKGTKHQRFILRLSNKQTVLVAHNIDLAPRVKSLKVGDTVEFYGEYEWNEKGGVIHWTHRDPRKRHVSGWLKHKSKTYR